MKNDVVEICLLSDMRCSQGPVPGGLRVLQGSRVSGGCGFESSVPVLAGR